MKRQALKAKILRINQYRPSETCSSISEHQSGKCRNCREGEAGYDGLCDACRCDKLSTAIDTKELPLSYRLILKIPKTNLVESASGVFWAIIVPLFIFVDSLINLYLFMWLPFPVNVALVGIVPALVFLVFLRIGLGRFINFWNLNFVRSRLEWNVKEKTKEYIDLLNKQRKRSS